VLQTGARRKPFCRAIYFYYPVVVFSTNFARKASALALADHNAKALPLVIEGDAALLL
jgi:hypothetical protein